MNRQLLHFAVSLVLGTQAVSMHVFANEPGTVSNAGAARFGIEHKLPFANMDLGGQRPPEMPRYFDELNQGLPESVRRDLKLSPDRNYVVLIKKAPQYVFDFRSAEQLRRSLLTMDRSSMDLGHAMVAWQCQGPRGQLVQGATGQTGEHLGQSRRMLKSGWGMSTFLSTFTDGYLNIPVEVNDTIEKANKRKALRFLAIEISLGDCRKMLGFLSKYIEHPSQPHRHFGMNEQPLSFKGGGCGSFALALLDQAGVLKTLLPHLWRNVDVPTHLLGVGSELPPHTNYYEKIPYLQQVSVGSLESDLWICRPGWAPCHILRLPDPELILFMMSAVEAAAVQARGLGLDPEARVVQYVSDPMQRSYSIGRQTINQGFDVQTQKIAQASKNLIRNHLQNSGSLRVAKLLNASGLVIEKGRK